MLLLRKMKNNTIGVIECKLTEFGKNTTRREKKTRLHYERQDIKKDLQSYSVNKLQYYPTNER